MNRSSTQRALFVGLLVASSAIALTSFVGCKHGGKDGAGGNPTTIVVDGSDTMVNLCQAWAEAYTKKNPTIEIQVSGGGSGVGINSLIAGKVDMANSSRKMSTRRRSPSSSRSTPGKEPKEHIVGLDALAIYVHTDNPLDAISIEELAEIYGDGGKISKWSQLGKQHPALPDRRDHARQPPEQLRHLRLLPRARPGQGARLQGRLDRPERLQGRRRAGRQDALRHRLQRHGLPDRRGQSAEGLARRRARPRSSRATRPPSTAPIRSPGRCSSTRPASRPARSEGLHRWCRRREGQKIVQRSGLHPARGRNEPPRRGDSTSSSSHPLATREGRVHRSRRAWRRSAPRRPPTARPAERRLLADGSHRAQSLDRAEPVIEVVIRLCGWSAIIFVIAIFVFVFVEGAPVLARSEPQGVLHQPQLAADVAGPRAVRHPRPDRRHAVGHAPGHAAGRAVRPGRGRLRLGVRPRQDEGNAEDRHRAAGRDSVGRLGIHRLHGHQPDHHRTTGAPIGVNVLNGGHHPRR